MHKPMTSVLINTNSICQRGDGGIANKISQFGQSNGYENSIPE